MLPMFMKNFLLAFTYCFLTNSLIMLKNDLDFGQLYGVIKIEIFMVIQFFSIKIPQKDSWTPFYSNFNTV